MGSSTSKLVLLVSVLLAAAWPTAAAPQASATNGATTLDVDTLYSIGVFSGAESSAYGDIDAVAFGSGGELVVLDGVSARVHVYDRNGEAVRSFGRRGRGPGEWATPVSMTVVAGDRIVVGDLAGSAYSVHELDGTFLSRIVRDRPGVPPLSAGVLASAPGCPAAFENGGSASALMSAVRGTAVPRRPIVRIDTDDAAAIPFHQARNPGDGEGLPALLAPDLMIAALPDCGLAVVDSSAYRIELFGPDGTASGRIEDPAVRSLPTTRAMAEQSIERTLTRTPGLLGAAGGGPVTGPDARHLTHERRLYPELAAIGGLIADWDGRIWVSRRTGFAETGPFDLWSLDGRRLGTVIDPGFDLPAAFGPDGLAALVDETSEGVPHLTVVRVRVRPPQEIQGIDHHLHIVSDAASARLEELAPGPSRVSSADVAVAALDAAGFERGLVLSTGYLFDSPSSPREQDLALVRAENDYVIAQARRYPDRLHPACSVNPLSEGALGEVRRCLALDDVEILKLHLTNSDVDLMDPVHLALLRTVFEAVRDADGGVFVHMRTASDDYGAADAANFVDSVLVPTGVPTVVAHMGGWGGYDEATDEVMGAFAAALESGRLPADRVWFGLGAVVFLPEAAGADTALASRIRSLNERLADRIRQVGPERVVYGTDWPSWPPMVPPEEGIRRNVAFVRDALGLTAEELATILGNPGLLGAR